MAFEPKQILNYKKNVGKNEQQKRYAFGVVALLVSVFTASVPLLLIGCILVGTAKFNWCPVWSALGKNTCDALDLKTG